MARRTYPIWIVRTALLAALSVGIVSNAAVVPGPWHDGRNCDVCRSGHQPILAPPGQVEVQVPVSIEWRVAADEQNPPLEPAFRTGSPRAPPA